MNKTLCFLAVVAGLLLTSCTGDELAESSPTMKPDTGVQEETPIVFSSLNKGITRSNFTGKDAATKLGNKFVVTGYKGPTSLWNATNSVITMDN